MGPVLIEVRAEHVFKNRGKGKNGCGFVLPNGSECRAAASHEMHLGMPLSLNRMGSRGSHHTYRTYKEAWQSALTHQLQQSALVAGWHDDSGILPRIESITAEGMICFPLHRKDRDQGNFRWFLEKCLGDALVKGGWLQDDSYWPQMHYEFGGLQMCVEPGTAYTQIMLFPG